MTPEGKIKKEICEWLYAQGVFFWVQQAGKIPGRINRSKFLRNGVSDILGIWNDGRMLAIEVKTPKGRTTDEQLEFLETIQRKGGIAIIARSLESLIIALTMSGVHLEQQK